MGWNSGNDAMGAVVRPALLWLVLLLSLAALLTLGSGEATGEGEANETRPSFSFYPYYQRWNLTFYQDFRESDTARIYVENKGAGNLTLNFSWEEPEGFAVQPVGYANNTLTLENKSWGFGAELIIIGVEQTTVKPPANVSFNITFTAVEWEGELPPDPISRNVTVKIVYEYPDIDWKLVLSKSRAEVDVRPGDHNNEIIIVYNNKTSFLPPHTQLKTTILDIGQALEEYVVWGNETRTRIHAVPDNITISSGSIPLRISAYSRTRAGLYYANVTVRALDFFKQPVENVTPLYANLTIEVLPFYGLRLEGPSERLEAERGEQGQPIEFDLTVTNEGNVGDLFTVAPMPAELARLKAAGWRLEPEAATLALDAANISLNLDTFLIEPGSSGNVSFKLWPPIDRPYDRLEVELSFAVSAANGSAADALWWEEARPQPLRLSFVKRVKPDATRTWATLLLMGASLFAVAAWLAGEQRARKLAEQRQKRTEAARAEKEAARKARQAVLAADHDRWRTR